MKRNQATTGNSVQFIGSLPLQKNANKGSFHPDQKYIEALLNNDVVVLEELYQKFSGKPKLMILQNNGTVDDVTGIFREALLAVYRMSKTKNFVLMCSLEELLYFVCKDKWMHELRKRKVT